MRNLYRKLITTLDPGRYDTPGTAAFRSHLPWVPRCPVCETTTRSDGFCPNHHNH